MRPLSTRSLRFVDAAVVAWVVIWLTIGVWTAIEVRGLARLSDTVGEAGQGLQKTATALDAVGRLPVVGGDISQVSRTVGEAGRSASASGPESRMHIERLSILLGLAVGLIPSVPLLAVYGPARMSRRREVRAVRAAVGTSGADPVLMQFLARRAADRLPYDVLSADGHDPWQELAEARYERLARLELVRLGIVAPWG